MKRILLHAVFLPALLLCAFSNAQVDLGPMALTHLTIIDADHPIPLASQTILVEGGRIRDVFTDATKPIPASYHIFDLKGKYVLPTHREPTTVPIPCRCSRICSTAA